MTGKRTCPVIPNRVLISFSPHAKESSGIFEGFYGDSMTHFYFFINFSKQTNKTSMCSENAEEIKTPNSEEARRQCYTVFKWRVIYIKEMWLLSSTTWLEKRKLAWVSRCYGGSSSRVRSVSLEVRGPRINQLLLTSCMNLGKSLPLSST